MDFTPKTAVSDCLASSIENSKIFESTPKAETAKTSNFFNSNPKKRKAQFYDIRSKRREESLELCTSTPRASSTLNESLTEGFGNIKINQNCFNVNDCDEPAQKFLKSNDCERIVTPPSTPESHLNTFDTTPKKTGSYHGISTPLKEQLDILYPTLKPLDPVRKSLKNANFFTQCSSESQKQGELLDGILTKDLIMEHVFKYLSSGDLFRFSKVSTKFKNAVCYNKKACERYNMYLVYHVKNKENYKITPPSSPETQPLFPDGSISPNSKKFAEFVETGINLKPEQSLVKCPKCGKPSVVEDSIAQCQEVLLCGYIFCQKCDSFAYKYEDFQDKCRGLVLGDNSISKTRPQLEDLTNNFSTDFNVSSILNSTTIETNYYSSGYFSGYDSSHTPHSVKRNLSTSFDDLVKSPKVLFESNRSLSCGKSIKRDDKRKSVGTVAPIMRSNSVIKITEIIEPSSPPKVKVYAIGSKESRRSLKRLGR